MTQEQMAQYARGGLIQTCFPQLSTDQREFMLSGVTKEEWDKVFPSEEEE